MKRIIRNNLSIDPSLLDFIETEALPGTGIDANRFWQGFAELLADFTQSNRDLLARREELQTQLDQWHRDHATRPMDQAAYEAYLTQIGYVLPECDDFQIETKNVDPEIAKIAGPQLVVPITNARFALNAANARWGSLYDAFYGTDVMGPPPQGSDFDAARGSLVVSRAAEFLDQVFPLNNTKHADAVSYTIENGVLMANGVGLVQPTQFVGFRGDATHPRSIFLMNHGLHVELVFNAEHPIGKTSAANLADVRIESAISAIMDCEDSVACVDGEDKTTAYRNWLGLMRGDLTAQFTKNGKQRTRSLAPDIEYMGLDGVKKHLKGRALLLVRNVGHLMTNPAILDSNGDEVFEGLMDAMITTMIAIHDLKKKSGLRNSVMGSIYIVKPKMHGPEEVAFADAVFGAVEALLGLEKYTVKLGIMDEERRTSVNLKACIHAAKHRVCFINTGFLDRTGDEIHTSIEAGAFARKAAIKNKAWITAYENQNVDIGLACGFSGVAQIGKGMWAAPDQMNAMLQNKVEHPLAGANCAWVPSPTAATLHAIHYHQVDVMDQQKEIVQSGRIPDLAGLLSIPLAEGRDLSRAEIEREVENNAQGILGYVVRWIDQGIGCSKVPDIHDVGLMEDRATCRISAQHIANWLHHGLITPEQVTTIMKRMAKTVDQQNANDPLYQPMAPDYDGVAFRAALALVLEGREQPSGYTEPILHRYRQEKKANIS